MSRETLEHVPERALRLLIGLSRNAEARRALRQFGFDDEERDRGIARLNAVLEHDSYDEGDNPGGDALDEAERECERVLETLRLTLIAYPEAAAVVLGRLPPRTKHDGALVLRKVLDGLDALDEQPGMKEARERVAARRIDRRKLRALCKMAHELGPIPEGPTEEELEAEHTRRLIALRAWLEEWSGFARLAITRRDVLIRLGLAAPRSQASDPPEA